MTNSLKNFTDLTDLKFSRRGKVREIYEYEDKFLMNASDRISCFDVVLPTAIPRKGEILTQLSNFWFGFMKDVVPNHLITANFNDYCRNGFWNVTGCPWYRRRCRSSCTNGHLRDRWFDHFYVVDLDCRSGSLQFT